MLFYYRWGLASCLGASGSVLLRPGCHETAKVAFRLEPRDPGRLVPVARAGGARTQVLRNEANGA